MKQRIIALFLLTALLAGLVGLSAASAETVTLTMLTGTETYTPEDINTMEIFQKSEAATGVRIEWITVPQGSPFNDKKALMLATDDLPDMIYGGVTASELVKYGAEGSFIPMEDLIAAHAPLLSALFEKRPDLVNFMTAEDGHMYGVPKITEGPWNQVSRIYNINTAWLERLGLAMPRNLSDFRAMLIAFRDQDPNGNGQADEVPMTFASGSAFSVSHFEYIFGAYGIGAAASLLDVQDGKVVCIATDGRYAKAIAYITDLYAEGLIDPDSFVMDNAQWKAKANDPSIVVGVSPNWDYNDNISDPNILAEYGIMPPLWGDDGQAPVVVSPAMYGYSRGHGIITKACKEPEAAMRWIDHWFDEINSYEASEGPIGVRLNYFEDGSLQLGTPASSVVGEMLPRASVCINPYAIRALLKEYFTEGHIAYPSTFPKVDFIESEVLQYADKDPFNTKLYYTLAESETISMLETDILNFINRRSAEWIVNGGVEADWEAFQQELLKMGLEGYLAAQQSAYDRMYAQ